LGLNLGRKVLDSLLQIDKRNPSDQVALLSGGFVGKGSSIKKACLAGLGIPLNDGINLLVSDGDLGGYALEAGLFGSRLLVAGGKSEAGHG